MLRVSTKTTSENFPRLHNPQHSKVLLSSISTPFIYDNTSFYLSEPVHCIVWAKHLFNQLFGEADPDEDVSPDTEDPEASGEDAGKKV